MNSKTGTQIKKVILDLNPDFKGWFKKISDMQIGLRFDRVNLINTHLRLNLCIPESLNTISRQLFDYTITFVNSQH